MRGGGIAPPDAFESRWLAEAIRLREEHGGVLEDAAAVAAARAAGGDLEKRIRTRAVELAEREGMAGLLGAWRRRGGLAAAGLCLAAAASGFGAALAVLGDGSRPVNIVWALGGLLGIHLLSLLFWSISLALGPGDAGGALGRAWLWLSSRFPGKGEAALYLGRSLAGLLGPRRGASTARGRPRGPFRREDGAPRPPAGRGSSGPASGRPGRGIMGWWLGAITHGVWLCALAGALLGLLAALSARRYGFLWETTILPAEVFVRFVELAGLAPAQLGFAVPEADIVRASGGAAMPGEPARLAWSSWLLGCVVVYGILPRLALWAGCLAAWRLGRRRLRLDLALPGYALLHDRLAPPAEPMGVVDAAPARFAGTRLSSAHPVGHGAAAVGLELGKDLPWPPTSAPGVRDAGVLDSRAQRRLALASLEADPPARLLVACDARLSPDRGSLELIGELSRRAGACRVWLAGAAGVSDEARPRHWREALLAAGLEEADILEQGAAALAWLEGPQDAARQPRDGRRE